MRDRLTIMTRAMMQLFIIANITFGCAFALGLVLSFPLESAFAARLGAKYGPAVDSIGVIQAMRALAVVGIASVLIVHHVLVPMRAILATVSTGDPFIAANADRLTRIGWGLLGLQIVNLAVGGFIRWLAIYGVDTATWTPQFGGWLGVLLAFVLARVFRRGAQMRDELAMTV